MKIRLIFFFIIFITGCSFDNKTGIWQNENSKKKSKINEFSQFKKFSIEKELFNKKISPKKNYAIKLNPLKKNLIWSDEFYQGTNNLDNFSYRNLNNLVFKSKKLSKYKINNKILFDGDIFLFNDLKGNIIAYSISKQKILYKFNFYKNKLKKKEKNLNLVLNGGVAYVSDNLGYLYAIDIKNAKLNWAKNFKKPFRSNIKIFNENIVLTDINNLLYFVNKDNGDILKKLPTEETSIKNRYVNNIAVNNNSIFYLNTYGSIYSINSKKQINWFLNLSKTSELDATNLFNSKPIILDKNKLVIAAENLLHILNSDTGSQISTLNISSLINPVISGEKLFVITNKNLLVCIDLKNGNIIYSIDIDEKIANYLDTKKKSLAVKTFSLLNNNVFIFLNNSYFIELNLYGEIKSIKKLPKKIKSELLFINSSIVYVDNKNKLVIID